VGFGAEQVGKFIFLFPFFWSPFFFATTKNWKHLQLLFDTKKILFSPPNWVWLGSSSNPKKTNPKPTQMVKTNTRGVLTIFVLFSLFFFFPPKTHHGLSFVFFFFFSQTPHPWAKTWFFWFRGFFGGNRCGVLGGGSNLFFLSKRNPPGWVGNPPQKKHNHTQKNQSYLFGAVGPFLCSPPPFLFA